MILFATLFAFILAFVLALLVSNLIIHFPERQRLKKAKERLELVIEAAGQTPDPALNILKDKLLSDIPALDRVLGKLTAVHGLQTLMSQADVRVRPGVIVLLSIVMAFATGYILSNFSPIQTFIPQLILSFLVGLLPYVYILHRRQKRFRNFEEQFPDALELIARALRAGHTFTTGLEMVATELKEPISTEFERTFAQQNLGLPMRQALINLIQRVPLVDVRFFVTAVMVQRETGGNLAEIFNNLGYVMRERFKLIRHVRAITAEQRLSAVILFIIPIALALGIELLYPEYLSVLFNEKMGRYLLVAWVGFLIVAFLALRKISRIRV